MKHVGQILKQHIESKHLKKGDVAKAVGITYNYLSTIFNKESIDAQLLEKLCVACGLNPAVFFETPQSMSKTYSDISATTVVGPASVTIGAEVALYKELLAEKERLIEEKERTIKMLQGRMGGTSESESRPI